MRRKFMLRADYLNMLRCFETEGLFNEKQVSFVHIFSPEMVRKHHLSIRTNLYLELNPEMLLYKGHIDSQGSAYVADRRTLRVQAQKEASGNVDNCSQG